MKEKILNIIYVKDNSDNKSIRAEQLIPIAGAIEEAILSKRNFLVMSDNIRITKITTHKVLVDPDNLKKEQVKGKKVKKGE